MTEAQGSEAGQAASEAQATQSEGQQPEAQAPEGYLDQKTVNKIVGQRAQEAEQKARAEIAEKFGYDDPAELDSVAEALKAWEEENETEADKQSKRAEKLEARAKAAEERYTQTLTTFALKDELRDRGVPTDRLDDALALAKRSELGVDKDGNVSGGEDVVEALLEPRPWLLEGQEPKPRVNAPQTSGTGVNGQANVTDPQQEHANFIANLLGGS